MYKARHKLSSGQMLAIITIIVIIIIYIPEPSPECGFHEQSNNFFRLWLTFTGHFLRTSHCGTHHYMHHLILTFTIAL